MPIDSAPAASAAADPRASLTTPLPSTGAVPRMVSLLDAPSQEELAYRAQFRDYAGQIRAIAREHFGQIRNPEIRAAGLAELREFTDPAAFIPMFTELRGEKEDVLSFILDHVAAQGDAGQGALAWMAIHGAVDGGRTSTSKEIRAGAMARLTTPASLAVLAVIDDALRSPVHQVANNAGALSGALDVVQAIPLLMMAQVTGDARPESGDLAWILIGTQQVFVEDLNVVVGDSSVAFEPVFGVVTEGVLLRAIDAVVVNYRIDIHNALVSMTTDEWGQSTEYLGYDPAKWYVWYNEQFVPHMRKQVEIAKLAEGEPATPVAPPAGAMP
jgi:hypothetical protein